MDDIEDAVGAVEGTAASPAVEVGLVWLLGQWVIS